MFGHPYSSKLYGNAFFQLESFVDKTTLSSNSLNKINGGLVTIQYATTIFLSILHLNPSSSPNVIGMDKVQLI